MCRNNRITLKERRKILIGKSNIHGWGAFAQEVINKNDFVVEYSGEVISQGEADRRGRVYDKMNYSYIFTLNGNQALDATRKGNKVNFVTIFDLFTLMYSYRNCYIFIK